MLSRVVVSVYGSQTQGDGGGFRRKPFARPTDSPENHVRPLPQPVNANHVFWSIAVVVGLAALFCPGRASADFTPVAGWQRHFFPSFVIATATVQPTAKELAKAEKAGRLGDANGLLGVRLKSPADKTTATVTVVCSAVMEPSSCTVVLPKQGKEYSIFPPIKYKYAALAKNRQSMPAAVTFRVEAAGRKPEEQTVTITVRSINDCPIEVEDADVATDVDWTFAAYVNEEHPAVDKITKEALQTGIVDSFEGYTEDGPEAVLRQVFALWHALSKRGVRYSDASTTASEAEKIESQHVRLIEESLDNAQANCVDGSVLFASLLRKIGLEPFLVLEPTHCYVGFYLDEDEKQPLALETTLLGTKPEKGDDRAIEGVPGIERAAWTNADTWATFAAAINDATEDLAKNRGKFESDDDNGYERISITAARQAGILPIPYTPHKE
jgi:hypothetical protein